jgi:hypothetical protein
MTKNIVKILTLLSLLFAAHTQLSAKEHSKVMNQAKIEQLDRKLTKHQAQHRTFKTKSEYKRYREHPKSRHIGINHHKPYRYNEHLTEDHRYGHEKKHYSGMTREYPIAYGRTHRHPRRGWILAYRYDRAAFYDRDGFYYGYFNHYGYYFEGVFYRYDRFYTYRDRMRGRGLFDRYFYRPAEHRYYGFCS